MQHSVIGDIVEYLRDKSVNRPLVGIVLGTGLNALIDQITVSQTIAFDTIPHFPVSTVEFHKGNLIFGSIGDVQVIVMQGRFHYYEGYSMQQITLPVRVMKELGVEYLFLSNAAGGLNQDFRKGDLVIVEDHINLLPDNPLRGLGSAFGNRFTDMSEPYDVDLRRCLEATFQEEGIAVKKGIYVSVMGPNLETKAEYRWLRGMGADMVGMSTVPEVIVANQTGIRCAAVSVITDECDPDNLKPVNIAEIIEVAGKADKRLSRILCRLIKGLERQALKF
jgi:purine-nucleoside phosphorylase